MTRLLIARTAMSFRSQSVSRRAGVEVKVKGRRGDFIFLRHTVLNDGREWVDLIDLHGTGWVSVRPEEITKLAPVKRGRK